MTEHSGNKYHRKIYAVSGSTSIIVDVYCVIDAYGVTCPALQHAIKKILAPGQRGKADRQQDIQEAIDALSRALTLQEQRVMEE